MAVSTHSRPSPNSRAYVHHTLRQQFILVPISKMQLSSSILSVALLVSSAMALPNGLAARGPGPACVVAPYLYGCGTPLAPKCCTLEECCVLEESNEGTCEPTPTACSLRHGPTPLASRGVGPACVVAPYLYGCGTSLVPQCCTLEEYIEKFGHLPPTNSSR